MSYAIRTAIGIVKDPERFEEKCEKAGSDLGIPMETETGTPYSFRIRKILESLPKSKKYIPSQIILEIRSEIGNDGFQTSGAYKVAGYTLRKTLDVLSVFPSVDIEDSYLGIKLPFSLGSIFSYGDKDEHLESEDYIEILGESLELLIDSAASPKLI